MIRPTLKKGDLVKLAKERDEGKMYRVRRITINSIERRRLGMRGQVVSSSEGFVDVFVADLTGKVFSFKRRDLWRVPNQPRDKKQSVQQCPSRTKTHVVSFQHLGDGEPMPEHTERYNRKFSAALDVGPGGATRR